MRTEWAKKMAQLLAPGGELITLMFPVRAREKLGSHIANTLSRYNQSRSVSAVSRTYQKHTVFDVASLLL